MNIKQKEMLDLINKFGCIRVDQIEKITGYKDVEKNMLKVIKFKRVPIKLQDGTFFSFAQKKLDIKMLKAIDVYAYLNSVNKELPVEWCETSQFPFVLTLFRNKKIYDLVVINDGQEVILPAAINRSMTERIIAVVESKSQIEKIKIIKEHIFCCIDNGQIKFYEEK